MKASPLTKKEIKELDNMFYWAMEYHAMKTNFDPLKYFNKKEAKRYKDLDAKQDKWIKGG